MNFITGKSRKINLPNGEKHNAKYIITELSDLLASHNEHTFADTIGYPVKNGRNINDRNYKDDLSAQNNVKKIAQNLDPEQILSLTVTENGTPVVNKDGIVVSGNNRIMSVKLAAAEYPGRYHYYKEQLAADVDVFGFNSDIGTDLLTNSTINYFDPSSNEPMHVQFKYPVLVRLDEDLPAKDDLTTEDLAKFNQDSKKGERPVDKAVKLSAILAGNDRCRNAVLAIIDGYDTFSDLYAPDARMDRKKLMESFITCGLIPEAQLPTYFEGYEFTEQGKDFVEMLLSAIILTPDALKISNSEGVKRLRQILIGSLPLLITNASLKDGASLKDYISEAIIVQYKIMQAGGDFADYIRSQSLFAEDKASVKSLYINSLLRTGRNAFKNAIRKYNDSVKANSGVSLFGNNETLSLEQIFKLAIIDSADEHDRKLINSFTNEGAGISKMEYINNIQPSPMLTDTNVQEIIQPEIIASPINWFTADNWYKEHPDKILGEAYETSGMRGKVTKYRGDISALDRINVNMNYIGNTKTLNDPLISVGSDINVTAELMKPEVNDFVKQIIEKADQQAGEKINRKAKAKNAVIDEDAVLTESPQLQTFEDVWRTYNEGISREELEVYVWYKTQSGKPLSRQWINLIHPGTFDEHLSRTHPYHVDEETVTNWVMQCMVYYYEGNLIYPAVYLSGNMYDKKMQLDRDKDEIIKKYGERVYENQVAAFNDAWVKVYGKRLTIGGVDDNNSLVIIPISKLSNEFKITRIAEMPEDAEFKIKKVTAASSANYGRPDWEKNMARDVRDYDREVFENLSLTDAFGYWMLTYGPALTENISHLDILNYYCYGKSIRIDHDKDNPDDVARAKAQRQELKASTQREGERLFHIFLSTQLEANDKIRLETQWNADYNNYLEIDFNKIPVAFNMCRYYKGSVEKLKDEKREAVAFTMNNGSGVLSYDVGVGKTPSAIFTMSAFMDAGYCKRPLLVVPNQVYKQFISEIKNFAPHIPVLEGYNLADEYIENFKNAEGKIAPVPEGVITIVTYEGLENIGFDVKTQDLLLSSLYEILNQGGEDEREKSKKQKESFQVKIETLVGRGLSGTLVNIEDFGFDFMCYDEAHKMKKVFTAVKGEVEEDDKGKQSRGKNPYVINSGVPSNIALKGFMLNYFIQNANKGQNILLLTATPFTNSPLEIFSILSMVGYEQLRDTNLNNIKTFFDTYVKTTTELVINAQLQPQIKQVIKGFNNLISLQSLIRRFINYKTGDQANVNRPNKYVLPYLNKLDDGISVKLSPAERIETYISMTAEQTIMSDAIIHYVETGILPIFTGQEDEEEDDEAEDKIKDGEAAVVSELKMSDDEKLGVRIIRGLTWLRNLALSAYLFKGSGLGKPTYKKYIENSPKLRYVMLCIKAVKLYHESKGEPICGQVIYMDRGVEYFPLIKEYLIKDCGFMPHEIGIIKSGLPKNGKTSKEYVKNLFNGEIFNEKTKLYDNIPDADRVKIIIGSSTIKEGINLQKYGAVLYNCFIDWNPTDIQQLEGRIWRQGNTFASVRIVNPLVIDSADIFLFQKLQEKTARLNSIWATDGRTNVLNTEEFDPASLKYDLIRDPKVIGKLKSIDAVKELDRFALNLKRQTETIEKIKKYAEEINSNYKSIRQNLSGYRNFESTGNRLEDAQLLIKITNDVFKKQTDIEGKKLVNSYERDPYKKGYESYTDFEKRKKLIDSGTLSDKDPFHKTSDFADFAIAVREILRAETNFIIPNKINFRLDDLTGLDLYLKGIETQLAEADEKKKFLESDEYKAQLVKEEVTKRAENKLEYKSVEQMVGDFCRLNYLLSDKKVKSSSVQKYTTCPPMLADGTRAIDSDALAYLDTCIASAGQTKDTYFDAATGQYTTERQAVHDKIINQLFDGVKCVKKGAPIAVFTGGSPASGKSTYLKKIAPYLLTDDVFHLDADAIRAELPGYEGWNANATHKETQDIVNSLLDRVGEGSCRYDFVYDGTMNKAQKYFNLINKVKGMGYKTFIIFLDIPYVVARDRALGRYKKSGRYVPMEVIDDFFKVIPDHNGLTMGQYALNELKSIVDGYIVIDGITGQIMSKGGEPLPQERIYEGQAQIDFKKYQAGESTLPVDMDEEFSIFDLWKQYAIENPEWRDNPDYISFGKKLGLSNKTVDELYKFNAKYIDFNVLTKYDANSELELMQMWNADKKQLNDTRGERKKITEILLPSTKEKPVKPAPSRQDIIDTIEGLKFLAEDGNQAAIDTIEGLKLLLD